MTSNMNRRAMMAGLAAASSALLAPRTAAAAPDVANTPPESRARILDVFPFERTTIDGRFAYAEWERLKQVGKGWPILIGSDDDLDRTAEQFSIDDPAVHPYLLQGEASPEPPRSPVRILAVAQALVFPKDFYAWPGAFQTDELTAPSGTWPVSAAAPSAYVPIIAMDAQSGGFQERLNVAFLPLLRSWEAPAYLRWGGWNACPPPEYHVAALRRWDERFGLEVVAMGPDRIDLKIANPPQDQDMLLATAREIYRYCPDIVDQGAGSLADLAATMISGSSWTLWWD
jgi:hypothetical protein